MKGKKHNLNATCPNCLAKKVRVPISITVERYHLTNQLCLLKMKMDLLSFLTPGPTALYKSNNSKAGSYRIQIYVRKSNIHHRQPHFDLFKK